MYLIPLAFKGIFLISLQGCLMVGVHFLCLLYRVEDLTEGLCLAEFGET
jgi:hypothetical protein